MIINTGGRTDTVQYYSDWLIERFKEGFMYSRNPMFPNKIIKYELTPSLIDCVVFCSKNYEPILAKLHEITDKFNSYFYYTITAYGTDVEPNVPTIDQSIETLKKLSQIVGKHKLTWRYTPILLTEKYTKKVHYETFEYIMKSIAQYIDRCIVGFVRMYPKVITNMPEIIPINDNDKNEIMQNIGQISAKYHVKTQVCATSEDYRKFGIIKSGCMTTEILGKANNITFKKLNQKGNREGCMCIETRNIGDYDTCPNGCKYCYANNNANAAKKNYLNHNPHSPFILGNFNPEDEIQQGSQKSFLLQQNKQTKLF